MGGCIPAGLNAPWLVDGAFALPSVPLFSCPGGPALTEVVEQTLEGLHHSEMAAGDGRISPPLPFHCFLLIQMGSSFLNSATIIISEPRTAFGSPNSHLGCHLVLSAESRGNSQGAWS